MADDFAELTFGDKQAGSERPLIVASGIGVYPRGQVFKEADSIGPLMPNFPRATEQTAMALPEKGVRLAPHTGRI